MTLNKFLAHAGVCSRRAAVEIIQRGGVRVNGTVIKDPGHRVEPADAVIVEGKKIKQEPLEYILLNKPPGFVTTAADERGRKTVLDLIKGASKRRIFPVGRLDINTTGLLLLTNDGALAQELSHPKYRVKKVYQITLNRSFEEKDRERVERGLRLEDGVVDVKAISTAKANPKAVRITLESGKNRVVRRIFESFDYKVKRLDRIGYGSLTTKGMPLGAWRHLNPTEIRRLKKS